MIDGFRYRLVWLLLPKAKTTATMTRMMSEAKNLHCLVCGTPYIIELPTPTKKGELGI